MDIFKQDINIDEYYKMMHVTETVHKQTDNEIYNKQTKKSNNESKEKSPNKVKK